MRRTPFIPPAVRTTRSAYTRAGRAARRATYPGPSGRPKEGYFPAAFAAFAAAFISCLCARTLVSD